MKTATTDSTDKEYARPNSSGSEKFVSRAPKNCKLFHNCSASLCPLDPDVKTLGWYPDERDYDEICRNPEFKTVQFVITQRKIKKLLRKSKEPRDDFFTYNMLNRDIIVRPGIRGILSDPSGSEERQWIKRHPERKKPTKEAIEKQMERMKAFWERRVRK